MASIIRRRRGLTSAIWGSPVSGVGCTPPDPGRREITHRQIRRSHLESGLVQSQESTGPKADRRKAESPGGVNLEASVRSRDERHRTADIGRDLIEAGL